MILLYSSCFVLSEVYVFFRFFPDLPNDLLFVGLTLILWNWLARGGFDLHFVGLISMHFWIWLAFCGLKCCILYRLGWIFVFDPHLNNLNCPSLLKNLHVIKLKSPQIITQCILPPIFATFMHLSVMSQNCLHYDTKIQDNYVDLCDTQFMLPICVWTVLVFKNHFKFLIWAPSHLSIRLQIHGSYSTVYVNSGPAFSSSLFARYATLHVFDLSQLMFAFHTSATFSKHLPKVFE